MPRLDESHDGQEIAVSLGETVEVCLPENPTTGFRWRVEWAGDAVGEPLDDHYDPPDGPPGASGRHCWRYRVARPGAARLSFQARRAWDVAGGRTVTYRLRVPG